MNKEETKIVKKNANNPKYENITLVRAKIGNKISQNPQEEKNLHQNKNPKFSFLKDPGFWATAAASFTAAIGVTLGVYSFLAPLSFGLLHTIIKQGLIIGALFVLPAYYVLYPHCPQF